MNESLNEYLDSDWILPRRDLLKFLASGVAMSTIPGPILSADEHDSSKDESFWKNIKQQFPVKPDYIMMNAANLCPTHNAVLKEMLSLTTDREGDLSFQNRMKFRDSKQVSREKLASYLSVTPEEIAITRNTSEGNNIVINGLDLGPGDEVLLWNQNHPSNNLAWKERAKRYGYTVKEIAIPNNPESPAELYEVFASNLDSRTRVLALSHVSNTSGIRLPVEDLCRTCRERGILTLLDGAQTFGAIKLDLNELGCDFYTGSMHKWPMGPKEAGLLYVRKGQAKKVWPSIITVEYEKIDPDDAAKFDNLGQLDATIAASVGTAIDFHLSLSPDLIESRLYTLSDQLKAGIKSIPGTYLHTPESHDMSAGVVIFKLRDMTGMDGFSRLYNDHRIASAPAPLIDGIRLSPHIYNTMDDIEQVVQALETISA